MYSSQKVFTRKYLGMNIVKFPYLVVIFSFGSLESSVPPGTQGGGGVEWQDPVTLANARGPSWRELVRGGSCNFKRVKRA